MFKLRGSRRRKTEEVIRKFLKSYAENEKSKNKKDLREWLISELKNELPNKKNEEIEKMAEELISGIKIYFDKKKEVEKYQSLSISNSDYVGDKILEKVANEIKEVETVDKEEIIESMKEAGNVLASYNEAMIYEAASIEEPQLVADALSANSVNNYIDNVNETIAKSNDEILKSLTTKTGKISQNPNLDGFIFEERHAGTFNIDASVKEQNYHAEALKPEVGETYGKNSVDMRIEDSNRIVKKYQAKAYKNANETAKSFYDRQEGYKYKFQSKLVPSDQVGDIENSVDKIEYGEVKSKSISKTELKDMQEKYQEGNKEAVKFSFEKDVDTIAITKQIGRQVMVNGTVGIGIGMASNIGVKLISGEEVETAEVIEAGIKSGASMGLSTAVAGGMRVAVEKKFIPTVLSKFLMNNNVIGAIAASSMDIIKTGFALGTGEITLGEATKNVGTAVGSAYGAIAASSWGYASGLAIAGMIGLGAIGTVGIVLGTGVALVVGAVCGVVGAKAGGAIARGLGNITEKVVNGAKEVVKTGAGAVKAVARGAWEGIKSVGGAVVEGVKSLASSAWEGVKSFGRGIASFFGW